MKPKLALAETCTACMACIDSCPKGALTCYLDKNGRYRIACDTSTCVSCNLCVKVCPVVLSQFGKRKQSISHPYAAWAIDDNMRLRSASGGIFAALAYSTLSEGGVAVGACMEGLDVKMRLIDKVQDIPLLQGSKYQQADSRGIYQLVRDYLRKGIKVLFSGAPCQICALYSFCKNTPTDNLITVDFICSGFPSLLPLRYELRKYSDIETLTFTDKTNGWIKSKSLSLYSKGGKRINIGWNNNGISSAFTSKLTHRSSCVNCRFCHAERISDMTLGDYWGDKKFLSEHNKGLSIVIVHSSKGEEALRRASIETKATTWESFIKFNPRMVYGKLLSAKFHPLRLHTAWFYQHKSDIQILQMFQNPWGRNQFSIFLYRIFQLLFYTIPLKMKLELIIKKKAK